MEFGVWDYLIDSSYYCEKINFLNIIYIGFKVGNYWVIINSIIKNKFNNFQFYNYIFIKIRINEIFFNVNFSKYIWKGKILLD